MPEHNVPSQPPHPSVSPTHPWTKTPPALKATPRQETGIEIDSNATTVCAGGETTRGANGTTSTTVDLREAEAHDPDDDSARLSLLDSFKQAEKNNKPVLTREQKSRLFLQMVATRNENGRKDGMQHAFKHY